MADLVTCNNSAHDRADGQPVVHLQSRACACPVKWTGEEVQRASDQFQTWDRVLTSLCSSKRVRQTRDWAEDVFLRTLALAGL